MPSERHQFKPECNRLRSEAASEGLSVIRHQSPVIGKLDVRIALLGYGNVAKAELQNGRWTLFVRPEPAPPYDPFYFVDGTEKAIQFETDLFGTFFLRGGKSGRDPIAATIMKDLLQLSKAEPRP